MSEAPERISIYPIEGTWDYGGMEFAESTEPNQVQYVRADRIEELEAELSLRTNLHEECIYLLKSTEAKMTDDLVKRLRSVSMDLGCQSTTTLDSKVVAQAADRIEALQAERDLAHAAAIEAAAREVNAIGDRKRVRTLHTDASRAALAERDKRIKREAREEVLRGVAEALNHAGNEGAASLVTALIEKDKDDD